MGMTKAAFNTLWDPKNAQKDEDQLYASVAKKYGLPTTPGGQPARITALGFGKLGGDELNYSSDIDLMFVYDEEGETTGKRHGAIPNSEFFGRSIPSVSSNTFM